MVGVADEIEFLVGWRRMILHPPFRCATKDDAAFLALLVNDAGDGLPLYLWSKMAQPGEDAWTVGRKRAARDEGSFSYRNAILIEFEGKAAGCLIGYAIPARPAAIPDDMPALFRPLQILENQAPRTWYVNVVAVIEALRNLGLGRQLMDLAEKIGREGSQEGLSLIVSDANMSAIRLYNRLGFRETARQLMVQEEWDHPGMRWLLMIKKF